MKHFEEFNSELNKIRDDKILAEWSGAFETAMDFMCQELARRAETSELPNLLEVEVHLLSFVDKEYLEGYDEDSNIYVFSTSTLPIMSDEATARLKSALKTALHDAGWTHMSVTIETYPEGHHVIAHAT